MKPIISVEGLGKKYTIRHEGQGRYRALREEIFKLPQRLLQRKHQDKEEFWALKDVSFNIMPGDRVGIIGRNGAGKSTLLKLLSRITEPSTGKITLRGRVASLLEVGTGFHPELTGRENIFLNGAILGMSRAEVRRKFDEIVDFAGVEKFLDTPVKRYSSGMYVRLAFAVAAHLEPEILIVDEVLAVGDAEFQKKCLGKMEQVGKEGRTVLFVSHNMAAIKHLCSRAMLFSSGKNVYDSNDIQSIVDKYLNTPQYAVSRWSKDSNKELSPFFDPTEFYIDNDINHKSHKITIKGNIKKYNPGLQIGIGVFDSQNNLLFWSCHTDIVEKEFPRLTSGKHSFSVDLPDHFLNKGSYRIDLFIAIFKQEWISKPGDTSISIYLEVGEVTSESPYWIQTRESLLAPLFKWDISSEGI